MSHMLNVFMYSVTIEFIVLSVINLNVSYAERHCAECLLC